MKTEIAAAKTSRQVIRGATAHVGEHMNDVQRARERYLAKITRADADYFEDIRRITEKHFGNTNGEAAAPQAEQNGAGVG